MEFTIISVLVFASITMCLVLLLNLAEKKLLPQGDVSILRIEEGSFDYKDGTESSIVGDKKIFAEGMVINGKWIEKI